jgi:hypothetical protein
MQDPDGGVEGAHLPQAKEVEMPQVPEGENAEAALMLPVRPAITRRV